MKQIIIELDGERYAVPDLGPEMNTELQGVYERFLSGALHDSVRFSKSVRGHLDKFPNDYTAHDNYFRFFAPLWVHIMKLAHYSAAESLWRLVLGPVLEWESTTNLRAHKGTPYYFWAVTALTAQDLDRGFLLMHRALQEDVDSKGVKIPNTPGNAFVTLDSQDPNQFFKQHVEQIAEFLDEHLVEYRRERSRTLTLQDFQGKFLANPELRPAALYFVYLIHKLRSLRHAIASELAKSDFAELLELDLLFGFCLVCDSVIKGIYPGPSTEFIHLAEFLLKRLSSPLVKEDLGRINGRFKTDFGAAISESLRATIVGLSLKPWEADIAITYGIRNRGAHNIEGHKAVFENFEEITQRVLNTLFVSLEALYP